jgi:hypothetical protein
LAFISFSSESLKRIFTSGLHLLGLPAQQVFEFIVAFGYFAASRSK